MKITVIVKANSKKESVILNEDGSYTVRANCPPVEGKANQRVIELLSENLNINRSKITLLTGRRSKKKIFEIS